MANIVLVINRVGIILSISRGTSYQRRGYREPRGSASNRITQIQKKKSRKLYKRNEKRGKHKEQKRLSYTLFALFPTHQWHFKVAFYFPAAPLHHVSANSIERLMLRHCWQVNPTMGEFIS